MCTYFATLDSHADAGPCWVQVEMICMWSMVTDVSTLAVVKSEVIKMPAHRNHTVYLNEDSWTRKQNHLFTGSQEQWMPILIYTHSTEATKAAPLQCYKNTQELTWTSIPYMHLGDGRTEHDKRSCFESQTKYTWHRQKGVVYKIPSLDWNKAYIRGAGRPVKVRAEEHRSDVRLELAYSDRSAVVQHVQNTLHQISWGECEILEYETNLHKRGLKEALHFQITSRNCN